MTTFTPNQQARRLADIEARTRKAWTEYSGALRDLEGRDYEEAENESWARLQEILKQLDGERQLVEAG